MDNHVHPSVVYLSNSESSVFNLGQNYPHDFTNYLLSPICAPEGELEVGVQQIIYTPKKQEQKFFQFEHQNKILLTVIPSGATAVQLLKTSDTVEDFLMYVNARLMLFQVDASITRRYDEDDLFPKINNNTETNLIIPADVSEALGFEGRTVFEKGEFISPRASSDKLFTEIPAENVIQFVFSPPETVTELSVVEPKEYTVESLVEEINKTFSGLNIILTVTEELTTITATGKNVRLEFSSCLREIFNLPTAIYISEVPYTKLTSLNYEPQKDIICVGCDIVEPSMLSSHFVNFLAIFKQSENYGKTEVLNFNPIIYYPVCRSFIQTIQIQLTDPKLDHFSLGNSRVLITLVFRHRQ